MNTKNSRPRSLAWGGALTGLAIFAVLLPGGRAAGQAPEPTTVAVPAAAPDEVAPDSPRAAVQAYLEACRQGDYAAAARFLALRPEQRPMGPDLARRFKAVLDHHLWIDLDGLSAEPAGHVADGLPPGVDEIGKVPLAGRAAPVRLVRSEDSHDGAAWVFSSGTVGRIDAWYGELDDRWVRERLPDELLRPGPFELAWWQWAALPLVVLLAWLLGRLLGWLSLRLLARLAARTSITWDDALIARLGGPLVLAWTLATAHPLVQALSLYAPVEAAASRALGTLALVALLWPLWRGSWVIGEALRGASWAVGNSAAQSLLSIGVRLARVAILALGTVALLSRLGYPVSGFLAGLGLGGLAFALAAQKTVENLFGSFSLAVDSPFSVGDFVRVDDLVGTVEAIGLRSTRIRTLDRTLVTIANGRLAEMRLESFSARDRMRLACTVGLVYETRAAQMRQVLEGLEAVLRAHPLIWPDAVVVRFKEFGASSLDIEIMAWFQTAVWSEFQAIRQEVLLQFIEVVEGAGTSFAFPTRTVHLVNDDAPAASADAPAARD